MKSSGISADALLKTKVGQRPENRALIEGARASAASSSGKIASLGGLGDPERKRDPLPTLDKDVSKLSRRKARLVICVEIVSFRVRELDEDNLIAGAKPLKDGIARSLGVDDADKRIKWRYSQVITECSAGTLVRIERLK